MYRGFPLELITALRCPRDAAVLTLRDTNPRASHVLTGELECIRCEHVYPIEQGIVRLLDPGLQSGAGISERLIHDRYFETYNTATERSAWSEMDIVPTLKALQPLSGKRVLELGAGAGRYTVRMIEHEASIIAVDSSLMGLVQLASRIQAAWNLGLVHADCTQFAAERSGFDAVLVSVISKLPDSAERAAVLRCAANAVKVNGKVVITARNYDLSRRWHSEPQSGRDTENGTYRYLFRRKELEAEVAAHFDDVKCRPVQVPLPFVARLPILPLSRVIGERLPLLKQFGELLLTTARRPKT